MDAGHFQFEDDGFRLINSREGQDRERELYINHVLLKLGITDKTDLQLQVNSYHVDKKWETPTSKSPERQAGFGDVTVRVKRNLIGDDNRAFALAALGFVRLPTGGAVGAGRTELGLSLPAIYQLSKEWNVGGQVAGVWSYDRETASHYMLLTPTLTVDKEFKKWLEGFVELGGYWDMRQAAWRSSVNLGPQFDIGDNLQIDFGTHLALDRQNQTASISLASVFGGSTLFECAPLGSRRLLQNKRPTWYVPRRPFSCISNYKHLAISGYDPS